MRSSHFIYDSFSVCAKRRNDKTINISIFCAGMGAGVRGTTESAHRSARFGGWGCP